MATPTPPVTMDTPISVRVSLQGTTRKFKIPLGDLNAQVLPVKLRDLLNIPNNQTVIFERFSDSAAAYVTLDAANQHVYKTLFRAAKAKLKLRLRATIPPSEDVAPSIPPFQPNILPCSFSSGFPSIARFGSETTLNNITAETSTPRAQNSAETLISVNTAPFCSAMSNAEAPQAETPAQLPKRASMMPVTFERKAPTLVKDDLFDQLAGLSHKRELVFRAKEPITVVQPVSAMPAVPAACSWSVFCNACDNPMSNDHYHCNVCDDGDYDLCETCVNAGKHCRGDRHWLVRRFVKNGQVVSSTTETLPPRSQPDKEISLPEMPGAYTEHLDEKKVSENKEDGSDATRTCNCCVVEYPENRFVTCLDCEDYDICIPCHEANQHGHHPGHKFKPAAEGMQLSPLAEFLCAAGRNTRHAALCDGCDKPIIGVRNKCLNCPDWDYCSDCITNAAFIHPGHRFAPLYDPISAPRARKARHVGIYCDGPLCESKHNYIEGVRYKCAICHDTDFCANCEAYPYNKHNQTHPLIQFKTPVRNATISTVHEDQYGNALPAKGDRHAAKAPTNAATEVQTIVDVKPAEAPVKAVKERIEIKDLLAEPIQEKVKVQDLLSSPIEEPKRSVTVDVKKLNAVFVRETIVDGSVMAAGQTFTQVWTMRNPGPDAWPAGCSVRYTGGDNMIEAETTETNTIDRAVEVGEEIAFRVTLKAPEKSGEKISYWRLKTGDGQAFGHRLWCHVTIVTPPAETSPLSPIAPAPVPEARPWQDKFLQQALEQRIQQRIKQRTLLQKGRMELEMAKAEREKQVAANVEAKAARDEMLRKLTFEMHNVETKHRARIAAAQAAVDAARAAKETSTTHTISEAPSQTMGHAGTHSYQDYQMQLMLLEQQNKKRLSKARQEQDVTNDGPSAPAMADPPAANKHALQDWQMQLMLLEQQNKKRLLMARQEQDTLQQVASAANQLAPVEVEAEVKPVAVTRNDLAQKSGMIFPTLDKESPVSSTHDISTTLCENKAEGVPLASPKSDKSESEIFEDAESVSLVESSDDEGFLTDEEYDILDASDEELAP